MNEIVESQALDANPYSITESEVNQQIATAKRFPRSLSKASQNVMSLVTLSPSGAEKCTYALPRDGKPITGPSIRLAEIVYSQWGNCRIQSRISETNKKDMYIEAEAVFWDLETNAATRKTVRRRISNRNGHLFNNDMILVTGNAAMSIAARNAIFAGVPEAIWGEAYDAALRTVRGDMKTLPERRDETLKAMAAFGLSADQVYQILGIGGKKDFGLDQIATLRSTYAALKNGEATVEELLKTIEAPDTGRKAGSITRDPAPQTDAQQNEVDNVERDASQETPHDPNTGEVKEEEPTPPSGNENAPDPTQFQNLYNTIVNDLMDAANPDDVVDLYAPQIEQMEQHAPDLHRQLMAEVAAAKE